MAVPSIVVPTPADSAPGSARSGGFDHVRRRADLIDRLRLVDGGPQAALICAPLDIAYLTGVREGISWLAVWAGGCFAVTRHMLVREVAMVAGDCELLLPAERSSDPAQPDVLVVSELKRRNLARVAVDLGRLSAAAYLDLETCASTRAIKLMAVPRMVDALRQRKDALELELISKCVGIAEQAFLGLTGNGAGGLIGRTELEIARELEFRMIELGADRQGFPETGIIVAGGPNSASAHHSPGARRVSSGEPLLIDWGAELDHYRSDLTRTLFLGSLPEFARGAYPVVLAALEAAGNALGVGVKMGEVDHAARATVMAAGFEEFHYGVGHGVGLAIHECPWLRAHSEEILEAGMVTTIEPGIYLPGTGGIRIEGMFALSDRGVSRLDRLPVSLDAMVLD